MHVYCRHPLSSNTYINTAQFLHRERRFRQSTQAISRSIAGRPFALPLDTDLPHSVDLLAIVAILKVLRLDGRLLARMGAVEELCGVRSTGTSLEADLCLLEVGSIGFGAA
jgi:hypothetical protein